MDRTKENYFKHVLFIILFSLFLETCFEKQYWINVSEVGCTKIIVYKYKYKYIFELYFGEIRFQK